MAGGYLLGYGPSNGLSFILNFFNPGSNKTATEGRKFQLSITNENNHFDIYKQVAWQSIDFFSFDCRVYLMTKLKMLKTKIV